MVNQRQFDALPQSSLAALLLFLFGWLDHLEKVGELFCWP